jgi:phosphatidylglycerophosphate synthase
MMDGRLRPRIDPPLERLAEHLSRRGIGADAVTWTGFAIGLVATACVAAGLYGTGLALFLVNRLLDGLDGALARLRGITDLGGYLDIVLDFLIYAGMAFGFAAADPGANALAAAFLLFAFMGTGSSFLAFAVMAAKRGIETRERGVKSLYYLGGLTEGTETILFFVLCALFPAHFALFAWIFAGLCWLTTAGRIATAVRTLRGGTGAGRETR